MPLSCSALTHYWLAIACYCFPGGAVDINMHIYTGKVGHPSSVKTPLILLSSNSLLRHLALLSVPYLTPISNILIWIFASVLPFPYQSPPSLSRKENATAIRFLSPSVTQTGGGDNQHAVSRNSNSPSSILRIPVTKPRPQRDPEWRDRYRRRWSQLGHHRHQP